MSGAEHSDSFACFGSTCTVHVTGDGPRRSAAEAVALARERLLEAHDRFSRFIAASELSRLNADPRDEVPASASLLRLAAAVRRAGELSGGLVDGTLAAEIHAAGYRSDLQTRLDLRDALALAPPRRPAQPAHAPGWRRVNARRATATIARPAGVKLDSGGLVKGLLADELGDLLAGHAAFAVNCAGDLALGGARGERRQVAVESPFDGGSLHTFNLVRGGVATSGIGRRSWLDACGRPAHHLLDPATGRPAYTGVVQVTALAPTALEAEVRAKAAVLSGPARAGRWLPDGGVIVLDDESSHVMQPPLRVALSDLSGFTQPPPKRALQHR